MLLSRARTAQPETATQPDGRQASCGTLSKPSRRQQQLLPPLLMHAMDVLITTDEIQRRVGAIASDIHRDYPGGVHFVAVLKGAFVFTSDLIRAIPGDCSLDFIALSSYGKGLASSGQVQLLKDLDADIEGRDVIVIEDIVDTGLTLTYLVNILRARSPRTLKTACLLNKPSKRLVPLDIDYVGFAIDDRFVVGYGLDHSERYRNLPHVAVLNDVE